MRRTLLWVSLAVTSMVALAFLIPLGLVVQEIARDKALVDAERQAAAIGPALAITTDRTTLEKALAATPAGADGRMSLHLPDGALIGPGKAAVPVGDAATRARTVRIGGGYVLFQPVALGQDRTAVIEVVVAAGDLERGVHRAWAIMSLVALALVLASVAVADRLGARVVRSSQRLASAAGALGSGDLNVRVHPDGPPELVEAGQAFNSMADRVVTLLAAEREMAADVSHRLRTPLAALRLNAGALGEGPVADQTRQAVDQLEREVDKIIRTVRDGGRRGVCDASEVLRDRVEFWSVLAEDHARPWTLTGAESTVEVAVERGDLAAAVDALLGNVFRHTPEGSAFAVTLHQGRDSVAVFVADSGPGIPDPKLALARGSSGRGSTGLGLDIARRLAESTGGHLRVDRSDLLGGAQIQLWLKSS
ncbi:HAMP domain-containing sensor histidine kinase [Actinocorallia longicatena]|uniref:Signal transduction histidine-protein kinase/phosphatase MprB n=1 Tax=Actinocorallia longicatena TaxID=111803 RepID=A0ABP6Q0X8_9ACTN